MRSTRLVVTAFALASQLSLALPLSAEEAQPGLVGSAREHYEEGAAAYAAGRYEQAVNEFLAADRLAPRPALSFNVARAYDKLGNVGRALEHYRHYLRRDAKAPNAPEIAERVRQLEATLASRGVQQLSVRSDPSAARLQIDEHWVGNTPWTGELPSGAHRLKIVLDGYGEHDQAFELKSTHSLDIEVKLEPAAAAGASSVARTTDPARVLDRTGASGAPLAKRLEPGATTSRSSVDPGPTAGLQPWPWIALGAGAAALIGSLGFELARASAESDARRESHRDYFDSKDTAESRETTARVLLGVGGVLALTGGVLLYLDHQRSDTASVKCGPGLCVARLESRF